MMAWLQQHWWVLLLAAPAGILPVSLYLERKRRESYATFCLTRGFKFERSRPGTEQTYAAVCGLFDKGHSRRWGYTISGWWNGRPFTAFEYRYTTGGGKSNQVHRCAMMLWEAPATALPKFVVSPEGFWQRLGQRLGVQDFDFPEDPAFSQAYQLQGDDEPRVRALFSPEIRRSFAANPGQHVAGGGGSLFWWRRGKLPPPDGLDAFFAEGDGIRRLFLEAGTS